ncbi:MAG: hypothetical protein H6934_07240 [Burkholderiaceae bacterium]|nr:hypothetical protein [Burkholderiaceae bacterium]
MKRATKRLACMLPIAIAAVTFSLDATAKCGCNITLVNGFPKLTITVSAIKTALKGSIIYNNQWTGNRTIAAGKSSKFTFDVNSACGKQHTFRFIRQNGKECGHVTGCGATITCKDYEWK